MANNLIIPNIKTAAQLGLAIKRLRKQQGLSQGDLSSSMNMRQPTISDIENGRGTLDSLFKIVQALNINLSLADPNEDVQDTNDSKIAEMLNLLED
jgi:transcriptional regulator with XRE-family HTH domain